MDTLDADLLFVIGLVLGVLSIPAFVSAYSESRAPRGAAVAAILAGALIVWASVEKPGGYAIGQIPDVFARVVGKYLN